MEDFESIVARLQRQRQEMEEQIRRMAAESLSHGDLAAKLRELKERASRFVTGAADARDD